MTRRTHIALNFRVTATATFSNNWHIQILDRIAKADLPQSTSQAIHLGAATLTSNNPTRLNELINTFDILPINSKGENTMTCQTENIGFVSAYLSKSRAT